MHLRRPVAYPSSANMRSELRPDDHDHYDDYDDHNHYDDHFLDDVNVHNDYVDNDHVGVRRHHASRLGLLPRYPQLGPSRRDLRSAWNLF